MAEIVRRGCLLLADISGYTAFVGGVELEHAHDILADLLSMVARELCPPLELAKLEGDAVFCAAPGGDSIGGGALLAKLESTYLAFARRRRTVALSSSCRCDACRRTPELDLKFCVHRGSFVEHEVAGRPELMGPDVVLVHRLLKNTVAETRGLRGYALISAACLDALGISGLEPHAERVEDVGEVQCGLLDLRSRWEEHQRSARSVVSREEARILLEADVSAPQQQVWDAMTDPAHGMRWRVGVDEINEQNPPTGRGAGTVTHCVHGRTTIDQEILDWLPPHHYTFRERNPVGECAWTVSLAPLQDSSGTHIEWRFALRGGRLQAAAMRVMAPRVRRILEQNFDALLAHIRALAVARAA